MPHSPSIMLSMVEKNSIAVDDNEYAVGADIIKKEETNESITSAQEGKVVYEEEEVKVGSMVVDDISTVEEEETPSPPTPPAAPAAAANEVDINIRAYNLLNKAKQACKEYTIETVVESPHVHNHTMTMEEFLSPPAAAESDDGMERKEDQEEEEQEQEEEQVVYNELKERVDADLILVTSSLSEVMDEAMNLLSSEVNNIVKDDDGQLVLAVDRFVINNENDNENEEQMANNTTPKSMTMGSNNDDAETEDDDAVAAFPVNFDSWNDQQQSESHNDNMEGNEKVFFQTTFDSTDNNNEQDHMSESPAMKAGNSSTLSSAAKKSPHKLKIETSFDNSSVTSRKQQAKIKISIKGAAEFKPTEKIEEDMMFYVSQSSPTFGDDTSLLGCSMPQSPAVANIVPAAKVRSGRKAIAAHSNSKIKIRGFLGNTRSRKKMESAFGSLK